VTIADHHRVVAAKENPVRSATNTPFNVAAKKDLPFIWFFRLKKNAHAAQGAEYGTNEHYGGEIHDLRTCREWKKSCH
jgi:hypothetical protein